MDGEGQTPPSPPPTNPPRGHPQQPQWRLDTLVSKKVIGWVSPLKSPPL